MRALPGSGAVEGSTSDLPRGRQIWAVAVMCAAVGLVIGMVTIVNTALPVIARSTGATQAEQTWIVDAYTLALAALVLPAGALGDRRGRRGVLIAGLVLFALSCGIPLATASATALIVSRAITGVGAALIMPATLSIINASFSPGRRGLAIGVWAAVAGLGGLGGLVVAGVLLQYWSWQIVFVAPAAMAVLLVIAACTVPTSRESRPHRFDLPGAALSTVSIGVLVFGILRAADVGWASPEVIGALAAGGLLAAAFALLELRRTDPLLDVRLFTNREFATGSLSVTLQFAAAFGGLFALTQYLQLIQGYSPLKSGLVLWPIVALLPVTLVAAQLAQRFGLRAITCGGLVIVAAGVVAVGRLDAHSRYPELAVAVCVLGVGLGFTAPPATAAILDNVPPDKYGVASAVNDATREVGSALGIALAGTILSAGYTGRIAAATVALPPEEARTVSGSIAGALTVAARSGPAGRQLADASRDAFSHGMWLSLLTLAGLVVAGALIVACIPAKRTR
ncbi:MFS transporter [Amycolatopsis taiwanensis]|nr:MFS transporter [Amycolatopsis taiwanensis]